MIKVLNIESWSECSKQAQLNWTHFELSKQNCMYHTGQPKGKNTNVQLMINWKLDIENILMISSHQGSPPCKICVLKYPRGS